MKRLALFRHFCQIFIICLFIFLPFLNRMDYNGVQGSLFSFDFFGLPFADPASAAQAALAGGIAWTAAAYFAGALLALLIAFFLGRVFCGWICPYGFFSELFHELRIKNNLPMPARMQKIVWAAKCALVALCLLGGALAAYPIITYISMPGQMSLWPLPLWFTIGQAGVWALFCVPIFALFCEIIFGRRLWCEYVCPQSAFLGLSASGLPKKFPGLRIGWQPRKCACGKSSPCAAACTLNINPRHKNGPARNVCVMCGACVEECEKHGGALKFRLESLPQKPPKDI